jgi:hypothetical protein
MRTVCAWCGKLIAAKCPHCNAALTPAGIATGVALPLGEAFVCLNAQTPIIYTARAIELMEASHGICTECFRANPQATHQKKGSHDVAEKGNKPQGGDA